MRVPISWLKEFVDIPIPIHELAERLTFAGLEVASVQTVGLPGGELPWDRDRMVVGRVREVVAHPNADRLVLAGEIEARVGETMSCLTSIERAAFTLRHVEGMSISEIGSELGLKTSATKHCIFRAVRKMRAALAPFVDVRGVEVAK